MEGSGNNDEVNDMDLKKKKMIPPIVVTVLMILYYAVYFGFLVSLLEGFWKFLSCSLKQPPILHQGTESSVAQQAPNRERDGGPHCHPGILNKRICVLQRQERPIPSGISNKNTEYIDLQQL